MRIALAVLGVAAALVAVAVALRLGQPMIAAGAVFALIALQQPLLEQVRAGANELAAASLVRARAAYERGDRVRSFWLARRAHFLADAYSQTSVDALARIALILNDVGRGADALRVLEGVGGNFTAPDPIIADAYLKTGRARDALFTAYRGIRSTGHVHAGHVAISALIALGRLVEARALWNRLGEKGACSETLAELKAAENGKPEPMVTVSARLPEGDPVDLGDWLTSHAPNMTAKWVAATAPLALAVTLAMAALPLPPTTFGSVLALVAGIAGGAFIGTAQWLVLRRFVPAAGAWIVVTALGFGLGVFAEHFIESGRAAQGAWVARFLVDYGSLKLPMAAALQSVLLIRWRADAWGWVAMAAGGALGSDIVLSNLSRRLDAPWELTFVVATLVGAAATAWLQGRVFAAMKKHPLLPHHHAHRHDPPEFEPPLAHVQVPARLPVFPSFVGQLVFPNTSDHARGADAQQQRAIRAANQQQPALALMLATEATATEANADNLFRAGAVVSLSTTPNPSSDELFVGFFGIARATAKTLAASEGLLMAELEVLPEPTDDYPSNVRRAVQALTSRVDPLVRHVHGLVQRIHSSTDPRSTLDLAVMQLATKREDKVALVTAATIEARLEILRRIVDEAEARMNALRIGPDGFEEQPAKTAS